MRSLVRASAILLPFILAGCDNAPPQLIPVTKEFTAESRGLQFRFRYPAEWKINPTPAPGATLSISLVPPSNELGTRIEFVLVDGDNAAKLIRNLPLIQPDASMVLNAPKDVSGHKLYRTEWRGDLPNDPTYRHATCLEGGIGDRFVSLRCYTSAPKGDAAGVIQRFERWRDLFEAMLANVRIDRGN